MANYRAHCRNVTGTSCRFLGSVALLCMATQVEALDKSWDGGAAPAGLDGTFSVGANWNTVTAPNLADVAHFGTSAVTVQNSYTVSFTTNPTTQALVVEDDNVTFDLDGHLYTMTATNPITLGVTSGFGLLSSRLTIREGFVIVPSESLIKIGASLRGFLTISTGGLLGGLPQIQLGDFGNGTLTVDSGGDISASDVSVGSNTGINGTATITGNGSSLLTRALNVGDGGTGTLDISGGGDVDSDSAIIGRFTSSRGTASVRDSGSTWDVSGQIVVGDEAPGTPGVVAGGTLNITAGGLVESGSGIVGDNAGSSGAVSVGGTNSKWDLSGNLIVGHLGNGTLNITAGGRVESIRGFVGGTEFVINSAIGTVNVNGALGNSQWLNSDILQVGIGGGHGIMNITAGGFVRNTGGVVGFVGDGDVTVDGPTSQWINTGDLTVGVEGGDGTLDILAGGRVESIAGHVGHEGTDSIGTVNVNGALGDSQWINSGRLDVGKEGTGTLNITAGGRVESNRGFVGGNEFVISSAMGTVKVDGALGDSQWINAGVLQVGISDGHGIMDITAGGFVRNTGGVVGFGGDGDVTVDGPTSQWINTGDLTIGTDNGDGTLDIRAGGRVDSVAGGVGQDIGSTGTVNVDGALGDSQWINSGQLNLGFQGTGTLNITAGGRVDSNGGTVGGNYDLSGGTGTVNVNGALGDSQWINSGFLQVGVGGGQGIMHVTAGGFVRNTSAIVGFVGDGDVTVDGPASQWINEGDLTIGLEGGDGTLNILAGGRVESIAGHVAYEYTASIGAVTVAGTGSTWTIEGRLAIGGDPVSGANGGTGTLRIQSGGIVSVTQDTVLFADDLLKLEGGTFSTAEIAFQSGGTFDWSSGTLHVGVFPGTLTTPNGGILAPGNSIGQTIITGNYAQVAGGTLEIEIGDPTSADFVNTVGIASLAGGLQLKLLDGFIPSQSSSYTIFRSLGISGAFDNVVNGQRLVTADGLGSFLVHYGAGSDFEPTQIVLSNFLANLPGDYNQDGTVNAADYTVWRDHLGQSFTLTNENPAAATPAVVDAEDYAFWKSRFGDSLGSGSSAAATATVPEPSTLVLLMFAAAGCCLRRRRLRFVDADERQFLFCRSAGGPDG